MTRSPGSGSIEFIRLAGHAVRVTSLRDDPETGAMTIVTIVRGSRDAELLNELLAHAPIDVELPGEPASPMLVQNVDVRVSGDGPNRIARFAMTFAPAAGTPDPGSRTLEERVAILEAEVARLTAVIRRALGDDAVR